MNSEHVSDEMLSAWVDGELDVAEYERVQAWLDGHPDDRLRVRAWAADRAALAARFDLAQQEPVPQALVRIVWRHQSAYRQPRWAMAAAAGGLLVAGALLGGGGVWQWQQQRLGHVEAELVAQLAAGTANGWMRRAPIAHAIYVAEPRHAVEVRANEEHLSRWLTNRIDIPVKLFDLHAQGFELVGGRLLPDGPGKSAQLMYEDAQKRRVTVYLRKPDKGADTAFRFEQQGNLGMFYWVEAGAGYALVGELPKNTLLDMAQAIYKQQPGTPQTAPAPAAGATKPGPPARLTGR